MVKRPMRSPEHPAGLPTYQLRNVRVFLLRHDAGTGSKGVVQLDKPEFHEHQRMISSEKRERCTIGERGRRRQLHTEIAVRHPVQAVLRNAGKCKQAGRHLAWSMGYVVPASAQEPSGKLIHPPHRILEAPDVPQEHLGVGHQMMPKGNRLGALQVRVARHHGGGIGLRLITKHTDQRLQPVG